MPPTRRPKAVQSALRRLGPGLIVTAALALSMAALQPAAAQTAALAAPSPQEAGSRALMTFERDGAPARSLTRADLAAMPRHVIETGTPWQDGRSRFEGVKMSDLFRALGLAKGDAVLLTGRDGYAAEFPVAEADRYDVILADLKDGKALSLREKGPLFVIYNFDAEKSRIGEGQHNRSVWQVVSMRLR